MKYFDKAQRMSIASLNLEGINAYLQDIVTSDDNEKPITCGLFRMEQGQPLEYTYSYNELKIMLEGEMELTDESGKTVKFTPGDVVSFSDGEKIIFSSKSSGLAFFCGQRAEGVL